MNEIIIDWELDEEEVQIIKDYIAIGTSRNRPLPLDYYLEGARREVYKHHQKKLEIAELIENSKKYIV